MKLSHRVDLHVIKRLYSGPDNMEGKDMGMWIFIALLGAATYAGMRRVRRNPLMRALAANMDSFADASRRTRSAELIFLPEREGRDRFDPVEVLAARRVA